jgi:hypothetical protein
MTPHPLSIIFTITQNKSGNLSHRFDSGMILVDAAATTGAGAGAGGDGKILYI